MHLAELERNPNVEEEWHSLKRLVVRVKA